MKKVIYMIMLCLLLAGCSHNSETDGQLNYAQSIMVDKPHEALAILSEMDTIAMAEPQKAYRALLQAYIAVTWLIPVDMPEADMLRVFDSYDSDCTESGVKALIVKAEVANLQGDPVARIEYLKDAEFLAGQLVDKTDLAFIYLYLSNVYLKGFNGSVGEYYANKSLRLFDELELKKQSIDARMAIIHSLGAKKDYLTMLDSLTLMREDVMTYSTDSYKKYYLDCFARALDENGRSREAIDMWNAIYKDLVPNSNSLAHMARAYMHVNRLDSALLMIDRALSIPHGVTDEYLCRNVQYDIMQRMDRTSVLAEIDSLRAEAADIDYGGRQLEKSSFAVNRKYESATQAAWSDLRSARNKTVVISLISVILLLICLFVIFYYRKRARLLQIEHENDMLRIQCLHNDLFEKEHQHDALSERIATLFKSRFEFIDRLAASYFECKETAQEQKKIITEAKTLIGDFSKPKSLQQLEEILNANRNDLMKHFDEDFPRISSAQRKLALFIFCGLSLQSISVFMDTEIRNIYVYKSRLKSAIARSGSSRRETYLEYFA